MSDCHWPSDPPRGSHRTQWGEAPSLERTQVGALYVVFAVVFCSWILKNLFVAVIVQSYTRTHAQLLQVSLAPGLPSDDRSIMAPDKTIRPQ